MTDTEILNIMYDHASGFSSVVQFSGDDAVIAFAREVLEAAGYEQAAKPGPEPEPGYEKQLGAFVSRANETLGHSDSQ
jgi:cystathionine beta-lyase family protein involved in aluminum resistance